MYSSRAMWMVRQQTDPIAISSPLPIGDKGEDSLHEHFNTQYSVPRKNNLKSFAPHV